MFAMLLILAASVADAGCGRLTVVDDPLDGRSIGFYQALDRHRVTGITLNYFRRSWHVRVSVAARGVSRQRSAKHQKARFVVGDDIVVLKSQHRSYPSTGVRPRSGVYTQWEVDFELSRTRLEELANDRIRVVGLNVADLEHRLQLSRRTSRRLQEAIWCAMAEVSDQPVASR